MAERDAFGYVEANVGVGAFSPQPAIQAVDINVGVPLVPNSPGFAYAYLDVVALAALSGDGTLNAGAAAIATKGPAALSGEGSLSVIGSLPERQTIKDTFSRTAADVIGTSPDIGQPWIAGGAPAANAAGDWSVDGSKLVATADTTRTTVATLGGVAGDMRVKATGVTITSKVVVTTVGQPGYDPNWPSGNRSWYLVGKYLNSANLLYVELRVAAGNGNVGLHIAKRVANVTTVLTGGGAGVPSGLLGNQASVTFDIELRVQGANVTVYLNNAATPVAAVTLTQADVDLFAPATGAGFNCNAGESGSTVNQLDAWVTEIWVVGSGSAALSGSGSLAAGAQAVGASGLAGLCGSGGLTGIGQADVSAPVGLSGSGQLSASVESADFGIGLDLSGEGFLSGEGVYTENPFDPDDPNIPRQLVLSVIDDVLLQAPTVVVATVAEGEAGEMYVFRIDGDVVYQARALLNGNLGMTSIPVDEEHGAIGNHTLRVTQGALSASDTFTIRRAPNLVETVMGPDTAPVEPASGVYRSNGTRRWVLQDLMPGGAGTYIMPVNPAEMDNPAFERALTTRHSTAKNGQWHLYEGPFKPLDITFKGYCPTEQMVNKMHAFGNVNRRFYLIDHRARVWIVSFSQVDMVARRRQNDIYGNQSDWVHDYTVTAQIHNQTAPVVIA